MDQYDDHHAECVFNFNQNGDVHAYGQCSLEGTNNLAFETEICDDNYSLCEN